MAAPPSSPAGQAMTSDLGAILTYAAAAVGTNSNDQVNPCYRGIKIVVDITAISGTTPTFTVSLQGKDKASGKYYTVLASAALNATGTTVLTVYPGLTNSANAVQADVLPATWRLSVAIGGTTPAVTATLGATLIP